MAYATCDDATVRYGKQELVQLTDRDGTAGAIIDAVLQQALEDASATIDGFLGGRYRLPLAVVPEVLKLACCDIARYLLHDDHLENESTVSRRHAQTLKYLEQVGKGQLQLGLSEDQASVTSSNLSVMQNAGSVFARNKAKGFI